jgi:hypothetical protein
MRTLQRHRRITRQHVIERSHVGGALDVRVAAQRSHAAAGPADVAENELQYAQRSDLLDPVGRLIELQRVRDRAGLLGA